MEYTPEQQAFYQRVKAQIKDGRQNRRTIPESFSSYLQLLTSYIPPPEYNEHKANRIKKEEEANPKIIFILVFSQDMTCRATFHFYWQDKAFPSILLALTELTDIHVFVSISTFYPVRVKMYGDDFTGYINSIRRTMRQASSTNVLIADLDSYHTEAYKDLSPEEVLEIIKKEQPQFFTDDIPLTVISSGHGLQLYLTIGFFDVHVPERRNNWKVYNQGFNRAFEKYGADSHCSGDITRVLRVPFSTNCKATPLPVKILYTSNAPALGKKKTFDFLHLTDEEFEYTYTNKVVCKNRTRAKRLREKSSIESKQNDEAFRRKLKRRDFTYFVRHASPEEVKKKREQIANGNRGIKILIQKRLDDLWTLMQLRDYKMNGCRNSILFIYGVSHYRYFHNAKATLQKMKRMNAAFSEPLSEDEVLAIYWSIESHNYSKFTNQYIMDILKITEEESQKLSLCYTEEQKKEHLSQKAKKRYKEKHLPEGALTKTEQAELNKKAVADHPELSAKELAELLHLSLSRVYAIRKELKDKTP